MILVLCGPTSAGKSSVAIEVAERFGAVILSADAMQVYRGMDIGTGKASDEDQSRVPHFGIDLADPDQPLDASNFSQLCDRVMAEHKRVILAGGTTLYIRSVLRGLVHTPPVDPEYRAQLDHHDDLHSRLTAVDPVLASRLHPNDRVRLIRGLEVFHSSGELLSALQDAHATQPDRTAAVGVWLDREDLDARIDARVLEMVARGYVEETRVLLERYDRGLKPMQSLGYRHMCAHILDGLELDEAIRLTQRDSRRFARKQRTWMKSLGYSRCLESHLETAMTAAEQAFEDPQPEKPTAKISSPR